MKAHPLSSCAPNFLERCESMAKNPVGCPPKYKKKEDMQKKIDEYFKACEGTAIVDDDGKAMLDKNGQPIIVGRKPLTITGLALALGFTGRQALLDYQARAEFADTVTRAKSKVEQYAEERLFDKDGANGAKFSLANNFKGWKERQQIEAAVNSEVTINIELSDD